MVASGGCTALTLNMLFPEVAFTLFDTNIDQINLVKQKATAVNKEKDLSFYRNFNIGIDNKNGLNSSGEFESLFRSFRNFIYEFIVSEQEIKSLFASNLNYKKILDRLLNHKYWKVAFDLYFSDSLLVTMFGSDAI